MEDLRCRPALVAVAEVGFVGGLAEFAGEQAVLFVRENHRGVGVEPVEDFHVVVARVAQRGGEELVFGQGRLEEDEH